MVLLIYCNTQTGLINIIKKNDVNIAIIESDEVLITDVQSALDLMATVR